MEFWIGILVVVLPVVVIVGGVVIVALGMNQHTRVLEMRHRERLAMIERGLAPPPERDPEAFETRTRPPGRPHSRYMTLGVALIAVGLGLMLIIGFAGEAPGPAVGIGGAIALLGAALIVNAQLQREPERPRIGPSNPSGPAAP
jgi:uncharacterized membrane protein YphA (DoxX/SURF4 family)